MVPIITNIDANLFVLINSHHSVFFDYLFLAITPLGSGWVAIPLAAVVIIMKTPRKYLARVLICAAAAGAVSGVVNTQIKVAVHRDRPVPYFEKQRTLSGSSAIKIHTVGEVLRRNSFPSGHTNTAFTVAALLALFFGRWWWSGFALAALVGLSRVYVGAHFPLDTVVGGLCGTLIAVCIVGFFRWQNLVPRGILVKAHDQQ